MADTSWRDAERRWQAQPDDPALLSAYLEALRRADRPVPGHLRLREVSPARAFDSEFKLQVWIEDPRGNVVPVGATPSPGPIEVPEHRVWWVSHALVGPRNVRVRFERLLDEVAQKAIPGIVLDDGALGENEHRLLGERGGGLRVFGVSDKYGANLTPRGVATLAGLPRLERLRVSCKWPSVSKLEGLDASESLLELVLNVEGLSAEGFSDLPAGLVRLVARGCRYGDAGLEHLTRFEELRALGLPESDASDAGFAAFAERVDLGRLESLDLGRCQRISGATVALLGRASNLARLEIGGAAIDDKALEPLPLLEGLEVLSLERSRWLTDRALEHVAQCPRLRELDLDHCPQITSRGLEKLAAMPQLERLYLRGPKALQAAQAEGRERLRVALPSLLIYR